MRGESKNILRAEHLSFAPSASDLGSFLQESSQIEFTVTHCELFSLSTTGGCQSGEDVIISVADIQSAIPLISVKIRLLNRLF